MKIYKIKVNGKTYKVELEALEENDVKQTKEEKKEIKEEKKVEKKTLSGSGNDVLAPIQGSVTNIKVKVGDKVKKGDVLLIIEAMKLENDVVSPFDGVVETILVSKGQLVAAKEVIIKIK